MRRSQRCNRRSSMCVCVCLFVSVCVCAFYPKPIPNIGKLPTCDTTQTKNMCICCETQLASVCTFYITNWSRYRNEQVVASPWQGQRRPKSTESIDANMCSVSVCIRIQIHYAPLAIDNAHFECVFLIGMLHVVVTEKYQQEQMWN